MPPSTTTLVVIQQRGIATHRKAHSGRPCMPPCASLVRYMLCAYKLVRCACINLCACLPCASTASVGASWSGMPPMQLTAMATRCLFFFPSSSFQFLLFALMHLLTIHTNSASNPLSCDHNSGSIIPALIPIVRDPPIRSQKYYEITTSSKRDRIIDNTRKTIMLINLKHVYLFILYHLY